MLPQDDRPIVVVGASGCGLLVAHHLARAGRKVVVYERSPELDPAERTLIVTSEVSRYVQGLFESSVLHKVDRFELIADGCVAQVELGSSDLIVERADVIRILAKRAEEAGAEIVLGARFSAINHADQGVRLRFDVRGEVEEVEAAAIIGADGAHSEVAKACGWPAHETVMLLQAVVRLADGYDPALSRVWFRPEETPYFYWLIPDSETEGALGVIHEGRSPRGLLDAFLDREGFDPIEYQAARVPRYRGWVRTQKRVDGTDVYLVGDAAAQVKVSTVGGLVTGFRGALGVVDRILGRGGSHLRSLRRELDAHLIVRQIMHRFDEADYVRVISSLNQGTRGSLRRFTRDEAPAMLARLALTQPSFLALSAKALARRRK